MNCIDIGAFIRQRRKELKLTQEQVCSGICDPVTLSRIENGKQTPSKNVIRAILQRLGMPEARYYVLESRNELEIEALKKDIIACGVTRNVSLGFEKLTELEALTAPDDHLMLQFILRSKALLGSFDKRYTPSEQIDLLLSAIHLTIPDFDLEEINEHLYAFDEIKSIIQIAIVYSNSGNNEKAADIFYQLLKYSRKHYPEIITSGGISLLILYNYARVLDLSGRYSEGAKIAKEGRDACIKYGHYQTLPGCLEIYAECCHFLGNDMESKDAYYQAYYLCKLIGRTEDIEITRNEARKYLNIEFDS